MISAFIAKAAVPLMIACLAGGLVGGIGLQQRVLSPKEAVQVDYDKVRTIVTEELAKLPKPKEQNLEIEKIKGKGAKVEIHQNYYNQINGDSLVMERFGAIVEEKLKALKLSRCK